MNNAFAKILTTVLLFVIPAIPAFSLTYSEQFQSSLSESSLSPTTIPDGMVYGLTPGESARNVTFSGTAHGLTGNVEVQLYYEDGGEVAVDWASLGSAGTDYSATINVPKSTGGWLRARYRTTGAMDQVVETQEKFGVGYKVLQLGQSQTTIYLKSQGYDHGTSHPGTTSYLTNDAGRGYGEPQLSFIGDEVAPGLGTFVDQMRVYEEKTPILVVDAAVNGTGPNDLLDDERGKRDWAALQEKIDYIGDDFSAVLMNWATTGWRDWRTRSTADELLEALIHGTGPYADQTPEAVDHNLDEALRDGYAFVLSPATRYNGSSHNTIRTDQIDFANSDGLVVGPPVSDFQIRTNDGPHQDSTVSNGQNPNQIFGQRQAVGLARAFGLEDEENPHFTGAFQYEDEILVTTSATDLFAMDTSEIWRWFRVDEGDGYKNGGFTASILDGSILLEKDGDSFWADDTFVQFLSNGPNRDRGDAETEAKIVSGVLYAPFVEDVLDLGLPVVGSMVNGSWSDRFETQTVNSAPYWRTELAAVPLPATGLLLLSGFVCLIGQSRVRSAFSKA